MSMFSWCGFSISIFSYTRFIRSSNEASSSSMFRYSTRPCLHRKPTHRRPSAMQIASSTSAKVFPALLEETRSILCPCRRMPSISSGFTGGIVSQISLRLQTWSGSTISSSM